MVELRSLDFSDFVLFALVPLVVFFILAVHELGHYIAARILGISVKEVSVGIGREIWSAQDKHGTLWSVRLYPIWAHVQITDFTNGALPVWKRFVTVLAGPLINLILPFFLLLIFFTLAGQPSTPPVITAIEIGESADKAGLHVGDEVLAINQAPVHRFKDIYDLSYNAGHESLYKIRRDGEEMELRVTPAMITYKDIDGINRQYPRLGVMWQHKPIALKTVHKINGVDTKGDVAKARELIEYNFGRGTVIGLYSNDGAVHAYKVHILKDSNPDIGNPDHDDHKLVFLGKTRDDFYYQDSVLGNISEAASMNGKLIRQFVGLPFQLLPIDKDILRPRSTVSDDKTWMINKAYTLIYIACLASLFMAFFNLLPLPRLDGGLLVLYIIEAFSGKTLSGRQKAITLGLLFFVFYCAVLFSNMDNMPGYIESRMKKLQEFMNDQ